MSHIKNKFTSELIMYMKILRAVWTLSCCLLVSCGGSGESPNQVTPVVPVLPVTESPLSLPSVNQNSLADEITPHEAVATMAIGINLGNTLDAPSEGEWALAAQEYYVEAFRDAGFKHVRIPITWDNHIAASAPYEIEVEFLNRVEQIVTWALDRELFVIINVHHDDWIKANFASQSNRNRFDSIWLQVAERFKNTSAKLIFEILNEPQGLSLADTNILNKRALSIIRNQTSNRLVIFAGTEWSNVDKLLAVDVPDSEDQFLIGNFHSYDPWGFAGECQAQWGSEADKEALTAIYQKAANWSLAHNTPVIVNEFGSVKYDFTQPEHICEQSQRQAYIAAHVANAKTFGIAATFWDDGGSFSTYNRAENTWGPEKDILVSP